MATTNISMPRGSIVQVNGVNYAYESGTVGIDAKWDNTSDNDSGAYEDEAIISQTLMVENITAVRKSNVNPHAPPLNIANQQNAIFVSVKFFPNGIAAGLPYYSPTFAVKNFRLNSNPKEGGHQTISFSGNSSGIWYKPGQS